MTPETWKQARPLIAAALVYSGGTHTPDDIRKGILDERWQLWCGRQSVIVTEIIEYPQMTVCRIFLAGGKMKELVREMEPRVAEWSASIGCSRIEVVGRPGWSRVLKNYDSRVVTLTKELENGKE